MTPKYRDEVNKLLAGLDDDENKQKRKPETELPPSPEPLREIHFIFVREEEEEDTQDIVDSYASDLDTAPFTTKPAPQPASNVAIGVWLFGLLVPLFCIAVQLYFMVNPFTVTVTLAARSQQVSLQGTLQLGRVVNPITLSQSQTVQTTGKGHQDAKQATGSITFYNGQATQVTVPAGTTLTGNSGEQIVTDQDANIPAESQAIPPTLGQATVPAHAVTPGSRGNIAVGDINQPCCTTAIKAINTTSFIGGQDERNFQTVAPSDITNTAAPLKTTLDQSMQDTLTGQLKSGEALGSPHCTPAITADHQAGQEATQVKVTVSETCSAVAYTSQELTSKVTQLLTSQVTKKLGAGYSLLENPQITVTGTTTARQVTLSFTSVSTWVYALSSAQQQHIKAIIAGKNTQKALRLLLALPGIESASLQWSGFGDATRIPKNLNTIHLMIFYGL